MNSFKWDNPSEWLADRIDNAVKMELLIMLRTVTAGMNFDTIQEHFESQMDQDGYFQEREEAEVTT